MSIGTDGHPAFLGLVGWQWVFIGWGIPAVILGILILFYLTDRPKHARWLTDEERTALEETLAREKQEHKRGVGHLTIRQALANPKVLALAAAYYFVVTGSYGIELYMASIVEDWYGLKVKEVAYLIIIPAIGALIGQVLVGWNSDRTHERRGTRRCPSSLRGRAGPRPRQQGHPLVHDRPLHCRDDRYEGLFAGILGFPACFSPSGRRGLHRPDQLLRQLGGWVGPSVLGVVKQATGSYRYGLWFLSCSVIVSALIIASLGIGGKAKQSAAPDTSPAEPEPEAVIESV